MSSSAAPYDFTHNVTCADVGQGTISVAVPLHTLKMSGLTCPYHFTHL